jgi:hypothetical protein
VIVDPSTNDAAFRHEAEAGHRPGDVNPAKILNLPDRLGARQPAVNADGAVLDVAQGNFEPREASGQTRTQSP